MELEAVNDCLLELVGAKLRSIYRAGSMLCLEFGDEVERGIYNGKEWSRGEYTLHVQSYWRMIDCKNKKILFSGIDVYTATPEKEKQEDFDYDSFDWDVVGANIFDKEAAAFFQNHSSLKVTACECNEYLDLVVSFSQDYQLQIIADNGHLSEIWRLLGVDGDHQLIAVGSYVEIL